MEDPLQYTKDEIIKNLILTETHLKQATTGIDEQFCAECLNKHFYNLEGLGEEGIGFTKDKKEIDIFSEVTTIAKNFRGKDYKKHGIKYAQKVRDIRKSLTDDCPDCSDSIKKITKGLNNNPSFNDYIHNSGSHMNDPNQLNKNKYKMAKVSYGELAGLNVGQFAAEGVRYLLEWRPQTPTMDKVITIGGGLGLQVLALFVKMPKALRTVSMIAGSNLFAGGVVDLVKGVGGTAVVRAVAAAPAGGSNLAGYGGKSAAYAPVAGGPVFKGKVTATGIPTQYSRASVLAGAQAYESPEHADLIRVD